MYIITAWNEVAETIVRSEDPAEVLRRARELISQGLRVSIVRTTTGESLAVTELEAEIGNA